MSITIESVAAGLPTVTGIDPVELRADPYPIYAALRREAPVAWVPSVRKVLISDFAGCVFGEQNPEIFSSHVTNAHMIRAIGSRPMVRKDDPEHAAERGAVNPTLRPKKISALWNGMFATNADAALDRLADVDAATPDLNRDFARPLAAKNLIDLIGYRDVDVDTFARWSADFIAGSGNVLEEQSIWDRCDRSRTEADAVLDDLLPYLLRHPDDSMASLLLHGGMSEEAVRANIYLTISGGVNEPQHMVTSIALLLDRHPEMRPAVDADPAEWGAVFDETVRYYTPIGMVTRETKRDVTVAGATIPADSQIGLILASANRDGNVFHDPDAFRVGRDEHRHLGFGSGTHMCAGKWVAESSIGRIAMPALYRRFPGLRVDESRDVTWDGWAFRGITALPVTWN
ncbi:cytochrome P450 [Microbacterium sp. Root61]|uniref:cytochrome P450 n=1 Tax=Microbacterium sp. Root61 TaxID=1736570 RepID=UPI000A63EC09|nr:cytochrome P450 [Microbacterium sp. Root61]